MSHKWLSIEEYLSQFSQENTLDIDDIPAGECIECEGAVTSGGKQWLLRNWRAVQNYSICVCRHEEASADNKCV